MAQAMGGAAAGAAGAAATAGGEVVPTAVLVFSNLTAPDTSDEDLSDVLEDVTEEAQSSGGKTVSTDIVRPGSLAAYQAARAETQVGDVFLKFEEVGDAHKCYLALNGRMFAGNQVKGTFMEPDKFDTIKV